MMYNRSKVVLAWGVAVALAACGESKGADPGGMGAGRPDAPGVEEVPATEVLEHSTPGLTDSVGNRGAAGQAPSDSLPQP